MCIPIDGISDHEAILTKSSVRVQLCHPAKRPIHLWSKALRQTSIKLDVLFWHFAMNFVYLFCHYSYQHVMEQIFTYLYSMFEPYSNQDEFIKITSAWDNQSDQMTNLQKKRLYNHAHLPITQTTGPPIMTSKDYLKGNAAAPTMIIYQDLLIQIITQLLRNFGPLLRAKNRIKLVMGH